MAVSVDSLLDDRRIDDQPDIAWQLVTRAQQHLLEPTTPMRHADHRGSGARLFVSPQSISVAERHQLEPMEDF